MSAYITHLAQVNEIQPVISSKDILATNGEALLAAGSAIDHTTAEKLSQRALKCPIEHSIALVDGFTDEILLAVLKDFISSDPSYEAIYRRCNIENKLIECVKALCHYKILAQKLNVLAIQMPDIFDQALFCGWMAVNVYSQQELTQSQLNHVFIAGACHDLGLLNISPEILFKTERLTADEWQQLQQHPTFSADLLRDLAIADKSCIRSVLEHHEQMDGTGYPNGKFEQQLCSLGRLLHMLDGANAIYRKNFKVRNRTLHDMIPVLQMATLRHEGKLGDIAVELFKAISPTAHCTVPEHHITTAIEQLKSTVINIKEFVEITEQFRKDIGTAHKNIGLLRIQKAARIILTTLSSSGIINDAYLRWLEQVEEEKLDFAYRELEDVILMAQEIQFHIQRYERLVTIFQIKEKNKEILAIVDPLKSCLKKNIPSKTVADALLELMNE